jgi:hypothetical protein
MPEPSPEELEAVKLRWRMKNPDAPEGTTPSPEESAILLTEVRAKAQAIENAALGALWRATRNPASRSGNSKHLLLFYYFLAFVIAIILIIALGMRLAGRLGPG